MSKPKHEIDFSKLDLQPHEVDFVIYHNPCTDGFSSAWCAWKYANENKTTIKFHGAQHKTPPQEPPDVTDKCVLILDYSYKWPKIAAMMKKAKKLAVLDHHLSARGELGFLLDEHKIFEMNHSGAFLAWAYFFPDKEVPKFIKYVENNDIKATPALPFRDEFSLVSYALPFEFEVYDKMLDEKVVQEMIDRGRSIADYTLPLMENASRHAVCYFTKIDTKFYFVVYLNTTQWKSELGMLLLKKYPLVDFSVIYNYDDLGKSTHFSLRSDDEKADVSKIAVFLGAGGHRNASAVEVPGNHCTIGKVIDTGEDYKLLNNIYRRELTVADQKFQVLYLNTPTHKLPWGQYLAEKHTENNLVAIWHYDGAKKVTWFTVVFSPVMDKKWRDFLIAEFKGGPIDGGFIVDLYGHRDALFYDE